MGFTIESEREYGILSSGQITPAMAAEYLRTGQITLRSFSETLCRLYPGPDLYARLTAAFRADDPLANPDSVCRKIRNWLSGQNQPANREDIFHIAFALGLSEADASLLLGMCTEYGIHYRNGRDIVYAWFLRVGKSYVQARDFFASLPPLPAVKPVTQTASQNLTHELYAVFLRVQTEEELRSCYAAYMDQFGEFHIRAYFYFEKYLDQLIRPAPAWEGEDEADYSIEAVMEKYFSMRMPSGKDRSSYSMVQKLLKHNWPNTTAIKNIRLQKESVPRKLLLLLYVVTENVIDSSYHELDEEYITVQERLEDHMWTLNAILADCGMPQLDLRNAMDWLVLYAVTAEDEPMSQRMESVIEQIFS